jgi:putative FmdB family regulatory protein
MALYEYFCESCKLKFEQITTARDPDAGKCPQCGSAKKSRKLISAFRVGGQGDLRESTLHGCHDHDLSDSHDHSGHDHSDSGHHDE